MTDPAPAAANSEKTPDLGPLTLTRTANTWCFSLTSPGEMTLELPPDYESFLAHQIEPLFVAGQEPDPVMDLRNIPAISSRQLGMMLALRKTLTGRCGPLRVINVSPAVRRLLDVTRTIRFFKVD